MSPPEEEDEEPEPVIQSENEDLLEEGEDFVFDRDVIEYIDSLKDKFQLDQMQTAKEFIDRINDELNEGDITESQYQALVELRKGIISE